jgi:hypothetical protein
LLKNDCPLTKNLLMKILYAEREVKHLYAPNGGPAQRHVFLVRSLPCGKE